MDNKIVLLGDSLTFGYGVKITDSWAYKLSNHISAEIINKGANGDTTVGMLDRFHDDVLKYNPTHIFIMGGTNDLLTGKIVKIIKDNMSELVKESKQHTNNIYIGIPPCIKKEMANEYFSPSPFYKYCEESLPELRTELIALSNQNSIKYVDLYDITRKNINKDIFLDGIHFNSPGNNLLLDSILPVIQSDFR